MIKVKFRVYVDRYCKKCKIVHQQPTHRELYHIAEGNEEGATQFAWRQAVALLNNEANNLRPLFQYVIPMRNSHGK